MSENISKIYDNLQDITEGLQGAAKVLRDQVCHYEQEESIDVDQAHAMVSVVNQLAERLAEINDREHWQKAMKAA